MTTYYFWVMHRNDDNYAIGFRHASSKNEKGFYFILPMTLQKLNDLAQIIPEADVFIDEYGQVVMVEDMLRIVNECGKIEEIDEDLEDRHDLAEIEKRKNDKRIPYNVTWVND